MTGPLFHIQTVANDLAQYEAMKRSFIDAGFTDDVARFTLHDNSSRNTTDPYQVLRELDPAAPEPYTILCHQDVRADLGHGADQLVRVLNALTRDHPDWAIAGNAGMLPRGFAAYHLNDPAYPFRLKKLPQAVWTLDENVLVIRRDAGPVASPGLHGFHFYGADACLCAAERGRGAYVVDFLLTHLSGGNATSQAFFDCRTALVDHWRPRITVGVINTSCAHLFFSRWRWLDRFLQYRTISRTIRVLRMGRIFGPQAKRLRASG
jgi:hypothetical protein